MIADIHLLLELDTVVSSQLFATVRRQAPTKRGEYRLLLAVLEDAINCFQENAHATDKSKQRLFAEVQGWITGEGGDTVDRLRARHPDSPSSTCAMYWVSMLPIYAGACCGGARMAAFKEVHRESFSLPGSWEESTR